MRFLVSEEGSLVFNRILVPLDGSFGSTAAGEVALDLARTFDSVLVALHVVDVRVIEGPLLETIGAAWGDMPLPVRQAGVAQSLEARGRAILDDFEQRAREAGCSVETMIEVGVVADTIAERARAVDLVVMGRRGEYAAFGQHPLGSSVHAVVRRAPKPVLVCPTGPAPLSRPLVAYDGSDHATRALEIAVAYAERRGVPLHVVAVRPDAGASRALLDEAAAYARGHGLDPVLHPREAVEVAETVLETARETGADLLVMGASGKGRLRELLLGSTTETILARFDHPVLLYR